MQNNGEQNESTKTVQNAEQVKIGRNERTNENENVKTYETKRPNGREKT